MSEIKMSNTNRFVQQTKQQLYRDICKYGVVEVKSWYGLEKQNLRLEELVDKMVSIEMENCFG